MEAKTQPGPGGPQPADEELMALYQGGESQAMDRIIDRHGGRLFAYLVRLTGSREMAEDAYQDTFLKVIRAAPRYRQQSSFQAWLYTIARNTVIDMTRREKYRDAISLDAPAGNENETPRVETVASNSPDPEQNLVASEMARVLEEAIASLSPEQREVFLLREKSGLSFKEVSLVTGAPLNTVKTRMHYALGHLKKALGRAEMTNGVLP